MKTSNKLIIAVSLILMAITTSKITSIIESRKVQAVADQLNDSETRIQVLKSEIKYAEDSINYYRDSLSKVIRLITVAELKIKKGHETQIRNNYYSMPDSVVFRKFADEYGDRFNKIIFVPAH